MSYSETVLGPQGPVWAWIREFFAKSVEKTGFGAKCKVFGGLIPFGATSPIFLHLIGGRDDQGPNHAEADELGVGEEPNALGELGILHFPGALGTASGGAAAHRRFVVP